MTEPKSWRTCIDKRKATKVRQKCLCGKVFSVIPSRIKRIRSCSKKCAKISKSVRCAKEKKNDKNPNWAGDNVGYSALHLWVQRRLEKPKFCSKCKLPNKKLDLANISQEYKRDLSDWEWLCRSCHMEADGRFKNLKQYQNKPKGYSTCIDCGNKFFPPDPKADMNSGGITVSVGDCLDCGAKDVTLIPLRDFKNNGPEFD